ncbi:hypothetical protein E2C01_004862 [Portunus trituberculatus]|uniref:Uncharacterized protein n=1 Tax=Portunus trituberculatus TaxID=210409 RepID=A0A5B7CXK5_PORTR|nr:hypothetical protein [Portunus trituberculatus]
MRPTRFSHSQHCDHCSSAAMTEAQIEISERDAQRCHTIHIRLIVCLSSSYRCNQSHYLLPCHLSQAPLSLYSDASPSDRHPSRPPIRRVVPTHYSVLA